jgi:hypothetical protein
LAEKRAAEERAKAEENAKADGKTEDIAKVDPKPTPTPRPDGYGAFGKINTAPIKDQIQRLYQAKKDGKLKIPDGKFTVGVSGSVNPDGTLANYRVHIPSGIQEIDDSAMAILAGQRKPRARAALSTDLDHHGSGSWPDRAIDRHRFHQQRNRCHQPQKSCRHRIVCRAFQKERRSGRHGHAQQFEG